MPDTKESYLLDSNDNKSKITYTGSKGRAQNITAAVIIANLNQMTEVLRKIKEKEKLDASDDAAISFFRQFLEISNKKTLRLDNDLDKSVGKQIHDILVELKKYLEKTEPFINKIIEGDFDRAPAFKEIGAIFNVPIMNLLDEQIKANKKLSDDAPTEPPPPPEPPPTPTPTPTPDDDPPPTPDAKAALKFRDPPKDPSSKAALKIPTPPDEFPNMHKDLPDSITGGSWFGKEYRVITLNRAIKAKAWTEGGRTDFHKKATFNNPNPFHMFLPCLDQSIKEFNRAFTDFGLTKIQLQQAHELIFKILESKGSNQDLMDGLNNLEPNLVKYLSSVVLNQYDRGDEDKVTKAYSLTDNYTLPQSWDLAGTHPLLAKLVRSNSRYLLGEFAATIERTLFYNGITYAADNPDPAKAKSFSYLYKDPKDTSNSDPIKVFSGQYDDKQKVMTLTLGSNLTDAAFAQGLQQMLVFSAQYAQQNNSNTFPVTLGENPLRNILIVMKAVGEFGLHVPLTPADKQRVLDQIDKLPATAKKNELKDLWNFACDRADIMQPGFKWNKQKVVPGTGYPNVEAVKADFKAKMADNADLLSSFAPPAAPTPPHRSSFTV